MSSLCIIPARGGSKRIPKKNIKSFCGKPIIAYSIEAAINSHIFSEVMVSTDSEEIAVIAKEYGATVPFLRSEKNSNDFASTEDVLREVIDIYESNGIIFNDCCCLYPAAPFVTSDILIRAYSKMSEYDSVVPIVKYPFPIQRAYLLKDECVVYQNPEYAYARSQDLEEMYHDCGQFYFFSVEVFSRLKTILPLKTFGYVLPESKVRDIDTFEDWKIAEVLYQCLSMV